MASRVVPASGATTCRSSPSSRLMIDDLPAFGRPTTATLIESGDSSDALRQRLDQLVEEVAASLPHAGRRADRIAEPEAVEVVLRRGALEVVELVHHHQHRALRLAEPLRDGAVDRMQPRLAVHHEQDQVGLVHRGLDLLADRLVHRRVRVGHESAGVHQPELPAVPLALAEVAVARGARLGGHDRLAAALDAVEERGLPHVGTADDGHGGLAHALTSRESASTKSRDSRTSTGSDAINSSIARLSMKSPSSLTDSAGRSTMSRSRAVAQRVPHRRRRE